MDTHAETSLCTTNLSKVVARRSALDKRIVQWYGMRRPERSPSSLLELCITTGGSHEPIPRMMLPDGARQQTRSTQSKRCTISTSWAPWTAASSPRKHSCSVRYLPGSHCSAVVVSNANAQRHEPRHAKFCHAVHVLLSACSHGCSGVHAVANLPLPVPCTPVPTLFQRLQRRGRCCGCGT